MSDYGKMLIGVHVAAMREARTYGMTQGNARAPIAVAALQQYLVAVGLGLGKEDDAAIAKV